jgi:hypothetical protein
LGRHGVVRNARDSKASQASSKPSVTDLNGSPIQVIPSSAQTGRRNKLLRPPPAAGGAWLNVV